MSLPPRAGSTVGEVNIPWAQLSENRKSRSVVGEKIWFQPRIPVLPGIVRSDKPSSEGGYGPGELGEWSKKRPPVKKTRSRPVTWTSNFNSKLSGFSVLTP